MGTWVPGEGLERESDRRPVTVTSKQAPAPLFLNLFSMPCISREFCSAIKHSNQVTSNDSDNFSLCEATVCQASYCYTNTLSVSPHQPLMVSVLIPILQRRRLRRELSVHIPSLPQLSAGAAVVPSSAKCPRRRG